MISAPMLGRRYWAVLCCASVLGANLGDVVSRQLGLGYWRGLPVLAAAFACVALATRLHPRSDTWYWIAIVLVRAAATNLSDWQILTEGEPPTVRSALAFPIVIASWGVALVYLTWWDNRRRTAERTDIDLWFWITMLVAGTLGTAVGDWLGFRSGAGLPIATGLSTAALAVAYATLSSPAVRIAAAFWVLVAIVRTWGTNLGDLLSDSVGLWASIAVFVVLMAIALYAIPTDGQTRTVEPSA